MSSILTRSTREDEPDERFVRPRIPRATPEEYPRNRLTARRHSGVVQRQDGGLWSRESGFESRLPNRSERADWNSQGLTDLPAPPGQIVDNLTATWGGAARRQSTASQGPCAEKLAPATPGMAPDTGCAVRAQRAGRSQTPGQRSRPSH